MRQVCAIVLTTVLAAVIGCGGNRKNFDGPTVDAFTGKVVQDGKPVSLPKGEDITLTLFHEKGQSFGIPLQPDALSSSAGCQSANIRFSSTAAPKAEGVRRRATPLPAG